MFCLSFASSIKNKLARQVAQNRKQLICELSALTRVCGSLKFGQGGVLNVLFTTENPAVARLIFTLFKRIFKVHTSLVVKKNRSLKKQHVYEVKLDDAKSYLAKLGVIDLSEGIGIIEQVPDFVFDSDATKRAYIRGLFLGSGSINNPEKSYHFELVVHAKAYGESVLQLINSFGLKTKMIARKNNYVIYLKEAEQIVDILNIIGAHHTLLDFENTRIVKEMRNKVNRVVNCDTANLKKTVDAAQKQLRAIALIDQHYGLSNLPETLQEVAQLRLDNAEISLSELGQMLTPPVGKSGINHRMKKIIALANQITEEHSHVKS